MAAEANVKTISELEVRVRDHWKCDNSYRFDKNSRISARLIAKNNLREALLLVTRNGHSLAAIIAELDKERTCTETKS